MQMPVTRILLCCLLVQAAGCSFLTGEDGVFRDRKNDYRKAESLPRMEIPQELDDSAIVDLNPVPPLSPYSDGELLDELPLPVGVANSHRAVMPQQLSDSRWLLLQASPSQVWPRLKEYLSANNLQVTIENGAAGMMEAKSANGLYRYHIEQGFQRNTAELSVRHVAAGSAMASFWPDTSSDPIREKQMLDDLATFFGDIAEKTSYSFAAQGISIRKRITLSHDAAGGKVLELRADKARSWMSLGQSLPLAGFTEIIADEHMASIQARFTPPLSEDDKPGFWGKLFGMKPAPYDKDVKYAGNRYRFVLSGEGESSLLRVEALDTADKRDLDLRREQNQMLLMLKERLF